MHREETIIAWLEAIRDAGANGGRTIDLAAKVTAGRQRKPRGLAHCPARKAGSSTTELFSLQRAGLVTCAGPNGGRRRWWLTAAGAKYLERAVQPPPDAVVVSSR